MAQTETSQIADRYGRVAGRWGDKMRTLGYCDAYLGFLAMPGARISPGHDVIDIGCGSGAFAEAWTALRGTSGTMTLLDPAPQMLARAKASLALRGGTSDCVPQSLENYDAAGTFDHILAAHVIEHCAEPVDALRKMRSLARTGATLWLIASKPHWCNAIIWLQWRHRTFVETEMAKLLADAGWRFQRTYSFPVGPPARTSRGYLAQAV
jgi:ubiquinone/menaquinone biosynthesis C-methylase UbiE